MRNMQKAVVTGGAGFIGSHLVERLVADGFTVTVVDNLVTGDIRNLQEVREKIEFIEADINDAEALAKAFSGATHVFHLAAIPGVPISIKDPEGTRHANLDGTRAVLDAAKKSHVKRVVYSSSAAVYGNTAVIPTPEDSKLAPISPYGAHKVGSEAYMMEFNRDGLETVSLRYFNVFGERQNPNGSYAAVIPHFMSLMEKGEQPVIFGDGTTTRDFTYVGNVVDANVLAAQAAEAKGEIFNIACGEKRSINDLVAVINATLGTHIVPKHGPFREGDIKESFADISKARTILKYQPSVSFEEGIAKLKKGGIA
jgi:nucleoside-diphosphate-sugar epimerase